MEYGNKFLCFLRMLLRKKVAIGINDNYLIFLKVKDI